MIEVELLRVAILVANKEVSLFITQKLRPLAIRQTLTEVIFEQRFLLKQTIHALAKSSLRKDEDWSSCESIS